MTNPVDDIEKARTTVKTRDHDGSSVRSHDHAWKLTVEYFGLYGRWPRTADLVWGEKKPRDLVQACNAARAIKLARQDVGAVELARVGGRNRTPGDPSPATSSGHGSPSQTTEPAAGRALPAALPVVAPMSPIAPILSPVCSKDEIPSPRVDARGFLLDDEADQ